jgi:hypothetical protein
MPCLAGNGALASGEIPPLDPCQVGTAHPRGRTRWREKTHPNAPAVCRTGNPRSSTATSGGYPNQLRGAVPIEEEAASRYRSSVAGKASNERRPRPSGRVWLVVACALVVAVFLALVLPSVFDVRHGRRSYRFSAPVERFVFDSKGTVHLDISPSEDGHVHIARTSSVSTDSRLVERHRMAGKTLVFRASCTGSRLGVLRRCEMSYHVRVPRKITLILRVHLGRTSVIGIRGKIDFQSDAGDFTGSACSRNARFSLGFGKLVLRDHCVPRLVRVRGRVGSVELKVPPGRYDVHASTHWGSGVQRPFPNVIEDPSSPHELDVALRWGGSVRIEGVRS